MQVLTMGSKMFLKLLLHEEDVRTSRAGEGNGTRLHMDKHLMSLQTFLIVKK